MGQAVNALGSFRNWKTAPKLLAGFSLVALMMVGVGLLGVRSTATSERALETMFDEGVVRQQHLLEVALEFQSANTALDLAIDPEDLAEVAEDDAELVAAWQAYRSYDMSGREKLAATFDEYWVTFRQIRDTSVIPAIRSQNAAAFKTAVDELDEATGDADEVLEELMVLDENFVVQALADMKAANRTNRMVIFGSIGIAAVLSFLLAVGIARLIARPLRRTVEVLRDVAEGRLDVRLPVQSSDEVGQMARALNVALDRLSEAMGKIGGEAARLKGSAGELSLVSTRMTDSVAESSTQAAQAAASADEVSGGVQVVASGATELSISIQEIASNATVASAVAAQAVDVAASANATINKLGEASDEIGSVLKVINSLAQQTNLLALNATIEAARAGESGKGFAVVASEVKELAQETSRATEGIAARVEAIQTNTTAAVDAISQITQIINQINETQTMIASAVEEQSSTTAEISRSVQQAAMGSSQITEGLKRVATSTGNVTSDARDAAASSVDLARVADDLNRLIGQFRH
jgi:methyl-accepting chemotaxis protein